MRHGVVWFLPGCAWLFWQESVTLKPNNDVRRWWSIEAVCLTVDACLAAIQ